MAVVSKDDWEVSALAGRFLRQDNVHSTVFRIHDDSLTVLYGTDKIKKREGWGSDSDSNPNPDCGGFIWSLDSNDGRMSHVNMPTHIFILRIPQN